MKTKVQNVQVDKVSQEKTSSQKGQTAAGVELMRTRAQMRPVGASW